MPHTLPRRAGLLSIALLCAPALSTAHAQGASAWDLVPHGPARLIAGATHRSNDDMWLRAGVEIRLESGWHTYWRYPGDAGVPPRFDFAGSENVKSVTVLWPAPKRFVDSSGGHLIGYFGDVVFPLRITASDTTKPSLLRLKLDYAVCANVCLPAEASLELTLSGKSGVEEQTLVAAEARVPRRIPLGSSAGLAIHSVHREASDGHERVVVDVAVPEGTPLDLVAEGPSPDWALPPPEPIVAAAGSASGIRRFTFDLDDLPSGTHVDGATLTFTAISPTDAIEVGAKLR